MSFHCFVHSVPKILNIGSDRASPSVHKLGAINSCEVFQDVADCKTSFARTTQNTFAVVTACGAAPV
eukprot:980702-Amphidinium_carterae.1